MNTNDKLTAWDYMHMPLINLFQHPDFDLRRFIRVADAVREANQLIASAIRQGTLEA